MMSFSLACFNVGKKQTNIKADLCLFQEVKTEPKWEGYRLYSRKETNEYNSPYNCVVFNTSKFEMHYHEAIFTLIYYFTHKLGNLKLVDRLSLVILECKGNSYGAWHPTIIVVSFHNPKRNLSINDTDKHTIASNAEQFFKAVNYLGQTTGYPVLVGGDFNCELLKKGVDTHGFIVPQYDPTIYRAVISGGYGPCIDFFAYKNFNGCTKIEVENIHAELVKPEHPIKGCSSEGQYYLDTEEFEEMKNEQSDHDPLRGTMKVEYEPMPTLTISYYNIGNINQKVLEKFSKINHTTDLLVLHSSQELTSYNSSFQETSYDQLILLNSLIPSSYKCVSTTTNTRLYYNKFKLSSDGFDHEPDSNEIFVCNLRCTDLNLNLSYVFVEVTQPQAQEQKNFKKLFKNIKDKVSSDLLIIMGDTHQLQHNVPLPDDLPSCGTLIKTHDSESRGQEEPATTE